VTDPDDSGNLVNARPALRWEGQMSASGLVVGDENGFLERFSVGNANRNAVSRVGLVDEDGHPRDRIAFLAANTGDPETPGEGGFPVDLRVDLYDGDGNRLPSTGQIDLPFRAVDGDETVAEGVDLLDEAVRLPVAGFVEIVVEIDSRSGTDVVERVDRLQFSARAVSD
jgi:hypothetical protein